MSGLWRLVSRYEMSWTEELSEYNKFNNNKISFPNNCDGIREIFMIVDLPELSGNMYWKNNLILEIFNSITISLKWKEINIGRNDLEFIVKNSAMTDKVLFCNLPKSKREKMSRKNIQIIFPLGLKCELNNLYGAFRPSIRLDMNLDGLIENSNGTVSINVGMKFMKVFYETEIRRSIAQRLYEK